MTGDPDAIVVGSGPNGLAAAITMARAGLIVHVYEGARSAGGGLRSGEVSAPGFIHDHCASVVATALLSPFFRALSLPGVAYADPGVPAAHLLAPDHPVLLRRSLDETAAGLGRDGAAWRRLFEPLVDAADQALPWMLGPLLRRPRHPLAAVRFAPSIMPAAALAAAAFRDAPARALFGALAAHGMAPLESPASSGFGSLLAVAAHSVGWPVVVGGSQRLADAMVATLRALGGDVVTGRWIRSLADLPPARVVLFDTAPTALATIAGDRLPPGYRRALERTRFGPGVCKVDWALSGPIPWRAPELAGVGTIHLGGPLPAIRRAERAVNHGRRTSRPFVVLVQPAVADGSRAPAGRATAWAYAHVPNDWPGDEAPVMEAMIEEAAPGFRESIIGRCVRTAREAVTQNPNQVGGDIGTGAMDLRGLLVRPVLGSDPYRTPARGIYLCSAATPPGGGVHGMSGWNAAVSALRHDFGVREDPMGIA